MLPWCAWSQNLHKSIIMQLRWVCCVSPFFLHWFPHNSSRLFPYRLSFPIILQGLRTLFGMHRVGKTPVLFCSLHNSNCVRLLDLPSWVHKNFYQLHHQIDKPLAQLPSSSAFAWLPSFRFDGIGTLLSTKEVRTIELAAGGLLFTGDCSGELKVWRWAPKD